MTDLTDEWFDVIGDFTKNCILILAVELISEFWKNKLTLLFFFNGHFVIGAFTLIHKSFLFIDYIHFVIENTNELMKHS